MQQDFYNHIYSDVANANDVFFDIQPHEEDLQSALASLEQSFSDKTVTAVKKMKQYANGFHLYWKYKNEEANFIQGECNIYHPYTAFVNNDATTVIYALPEEPDFLCYIDNHPKIADDVYTIAAIDDTTNDVVLGYSDGGRCYVLSINWDEYHLGLAATLGYPHWQICFVATPTPEQTAWITESFLPKMLADMKLCFPSKKMDDFIAMVKRKNSKLNLKQ